MEFWTRRSSVADADFEVNLMSKDPAEKIQSAEHARTVMAIVDSAMRVQSRGPRLISLRPVNLNRVPPCAELSLIDRVENAVVDGKIKKWLELADRMLTGHGTTATGLMRS